MNLLDEANGMFFHANRAEDAPPWRDPIEIRRPGRGDVEEPELAPRRQATAEELRAFFGNAIRYTGPTEESPTPITDPVA